MSLNNLDGEVSVMCEFWGMRSVPLLPPGAVQHDRVLSNGQIDKLFNYAKQYCLK